MTTTGFAGETTEHYGTRFLFTYRVDLVGQGVSHYTCGTCAASVIVIHQINGDASLIAHGRWHAYQEKP